MVPHHGVTMHYTAAYVTVVPDGLTTNVVQATLWTYTDKLDKLHNEMCAMAESLSRRFGDFKDSLEKGFILDSPWGSSYVMDLAQKRTEYDITYSNFLTLLRLNVGPGYAAEYTKEIQRRFAGAEKK